MLTKTDLDQIGKVVKKIVREEVEAEIKETREDLLYEIKLVRMEFSARLDKIEDKLKDLDIRVTKIETSLDKITKETAKIKKDIRKIIEYHDEYYIHLRKRVERIEEHLRI